MTGNDDFVTLSPPQPRLGGSSLLTTGAALTSLLPTCDFLPRTYGSTKQESQVKGEVARSAKATLSRPAGGRAALA
jgi:hypothetical protein